MDLSFQNFLSLWLGIAVLTFLSLFFIDAPYGRHNRKGWGPQMDNRWGWIIMEVVSPAALSYFFWSSGNKNSAVLLFYALWMFHYLYRSIYFPLRMNANGKTIPLSIVLMAVFFNSVNGSTNGYFFAEYADLYANYSFFSAQFVVGASLFVAGFYTHFRSDQILLQLRKDNEGYVIPNQFLFRKIASPNYLGEMMEWLGFAIMTNALSAWCFWAWTVANLLPRAIANYRWYKKQFPNFPEDRKILIPGLF